MTLDQWIHFEGSMDDPDANQSITSVAYLVKKLTMQGIELTLLVGTQVDIQSSKSLGMYFFFDHNLQH